MAGERHSGSLMVAKLGVYLRSFGTCRWEVQVQKHRGGFSLWLLFVLMRLTRFPFSTNHRLALLIATFSYPCRSHLRRRNSCRSTLAAASSPTSSWATTETCMYAHPSRCPRTHALLVRGSYPHIVREGADFNAFAP
ncbi:hypothetical protein CPC08DRAFT_465996 [Agrocybe pediades]|nr:hypothetical protein CPC08DRAFT_465996 [Agrocybe pediades]